MIFFLAENNLLTHNLSIYVENRLVIEWCKLGIILSQTHICLISRGLCQRNEAGKYRLLRRFNNRVDIVAHEGKIRIRFAARLGQETGIDIRQLHAGIMRHQLGGVPH